MPGLGLKRGLEDDLVISPYSTLMAISFDKDSGIKNLKELEKLGGLGRYGFIEALDYTKARKDKYIMTLSKNDLLEQNISTNGKNYTQNVDKYEDYVDNYEK